MRGLATLIEKIPPHLRSSFMEGINRVDQIDCDERILERLTRNIAKYDWDAYLTLNPDIASYGYNPILHYLLHGWKEGRPVAIAGPDHEPSSQTTAKVRSCKQLRNGLVYEGGSLYPCCAVHSGEKPLLARVNEDGTFDIEQVIAVRKQIERELNTPGASSVCSGCPLIEELPICPPGEEDSFYICKGFNLGESHHCNFRCVYCVFNQMRMCSEPRRVTMTPIIKFMLGHNLLANDAYISIAGGEPLLMPDFEESLALLLESGDKAITLNTNLSVWSEPLAKALDSGKILIRCSIDSGTPKTFSELKGRNLFWKVVENATRYASINSEQVILKYICLKQNSNDTDLLGILNIINANKTRLLIDFDYYTPPEKPLLRFAGKLKALADLSGISADIRYEAENNWPQPIQLRKKLDTYEMIYLQNIFKLSGSKIVNSAPYKAHHFPPKGWIDNIAFDKEAGFSVSGWAWDHHLGAPKAIRVYAGKQLISVGKTSHIRLDIEAGAKAGFTFSRKPNPVLKKLLNKAQEIAVYVTFDGLKWEKLPIAPRAMTDRK